MYNFRFNLNFVPVSTEFIEEHMSAAHGEYVKVYLYIMYMAIRGKSAEPKTIAKKLNMMESDVVNAIEYWQERSLLSSDGVTVTVGEAEAEEAPQQKPRPAKKERRAKKTAAQISADPLANKQLAEIRETAEAILEKNMNDSEISTLYWVLDELHFAPELIMALLEYCVSIGKRDMRYIEKVAIGWHEKGINTVTAADEYINAEKERRRFSSELKSIFGITDRRLSKTEEALIAKWHDEFGMSAEMIALAYEYCVIATNKLSFPYMDGIIQNWRAKEITTVEAAEKDHEEHKQRGGKKYNDRATSVYTPDGTDYDEIERRMNEKY